MNKVRNAHLLKESIAHWQRLRKLSALQVRQNDTLNGENPFAEHCPLCKEYLKGRPKTECCVGCPIAKHSGMKKCRNTPWEKARDTWGDVVCAASGVDNNLVHWIAEEHLARWQTACDKELLFLREVLGEVTSASKELTLREKLEILVSEMLAVMHADSEEVEAYVEELFALVSLEVLRAETKTLAQCRNSLKKLLGVPEERKQV
jgi:hypothetical protein